MTLVALLAVQGCSASLSRECHNESGDVNSDRIARIWMYLGGFKYVKKEKENQAGFTAEQFLLPSYNTFQSALRYLQIIKKTFTLNYVVFCMTETN